MERLDKLLAATGRWSRKEAKALIKSGRVLVDGQRPNGPEDKVPPEALLTLDGRPLAAERYLYLMLHKPPGVVSSTQDPRDPTVLTLLPPHLQKTGLFPVGRLDKDAEGLLLLTNDGPLAHRLLSPKRHVDKVYYLEVDGVLDQGDVEAVRAGVVLGDGYTCLPGELELLGGGRARIAIHEGKYHQVKRMMAARGKPVTYLERVRFGPLELDRALPRGAYRRLNDEELKGIFSQ